jgi:hypothetical protein
MTTETIHLEGYSANLRRQKIYCFGDTSNLDKMFHGLLNMYSEEVLKNHKVIVLFSDIYVKHNPKWLRNVLVDACYRIKDSKDLQLAYTYIQHCAKPLLILWYSNEIPQVIFTNLNSTKEDITLITGGTNVRYDYSSIFFTMKTTYEEIYSVLASRLKNIDIKSVLNETKASDVSLVYNSGSLCWFDYNSIQGIAPIINYKQASDYLRSLADALELKE